MSLRAGEVGHGQGLRFVVQPATADAVDLEPHLDVAGRRLEADALRGVGSGGTWRRP